MPSAPPPATVETGDLIELEYELWAEGGGRSELIGTTSETVAQGAWGALPQGVTFGAQPHRVAGSFFPEGVEKALVGAKIGEEFERTFPPAEAFGERDPELIELFSMNEVQRLPEMRREDASLDIGTVLTLRGRRGRVVSLTQARVRVDFNPTFAGRTLRGKFKVLSRIEGHPAQAKAVIELEYGHAGEFSIEIHGKSLTLGVPDRAKFDLQWFRSKPRVIDQLRSQLGVHAIKIVEEFIPAKPKEESAAPAPAQAPPSPPKPA